ncbi:MAG: T9SS type A sorting domain-containing protein [Ignavibacteriae bacterium]|nr:T9SS type A sorting domain-containing protein [Ignavibacteriota bacterium]
MGEHAGWDFPVTSGAAQPIFGGGNRDGFVASFDMTGALRWSTFSGGLNDDYLYDVDVTPNGDVVVCGASQSPDFPVSPCLYPDPGPGYSRNIIVAKYTPTGALRTSTFYGNILDEAFCLAINDEIHALIAGRCSNPYPVSLDAFQRTPGGGGDAFITRLPLIPRLEAAAGNDVGICPGDTVQLRLGLGCGQGPLSFHWSPAAGLDNAAQAQPAASPTVTTDYVVTVTDAYSCTRVDTQRVVVHNPPRVTMGAGPELCRGEEAALASSVTEGRAPYTYTWLPSAGLSDPAVPDPLASPDSTTVYTLYVSDANGCTGRDSVRVVVLDRPRAAAGGDTSLCLGASTRIGAPAAGGTPTYTYVWTPPGELDDASSPTPRLTPGASGAFVVTVTDAKGCTDSDTVHVTVHTPPRAAAGNATTLCAGRSTRIGGEATGGTAPYVYTWSPAAGLDRRDIAMPTAAPAVSTTYHVTVTDAYGCTATDSVRVTVAPNPVVDAGTGTMICAGERALLDARVSTGTAPYTYAWTPPSDIPLPFTPRAEAWPARSTTYHVLVTDANGCTAEDSVRVTVLPAPVPHITAGGRTTFCLGDSVVLEADTGYTTYRWRTPRGDSLAGRRIMARADGVYLLAVTNRDGCTGHDSMMVRVLPGFALGVTLRGAAAFCAGDSALLEAQDGYTDYVWRNERDSVIATTRACVARQGGTYTATARDSTGCRGLSQPLRIVVHALPAPAIAGPRASCANGRGTYTVAAQPGRGRVWRVTGGSIESGQGTARIGVRWGASDTGVVEVTETVDSSGCTRRALFVVTIGTSLEPVVTGPHTLCAGDTASLDAGEGYATYEWREAATGTVVATTRVHRTAARGPYTVYVTDGEGCSGSSVAHLLTVFERPVVTIQGAGDLCEGDTVLLTPNTSFTTYRWYRSDTLAGTEQTLAITRGGRYTLLATDTNGCTGAAAHAVLEHARPRPVIVGPALVCTGDGSALEGGAGYRTYIWRDEAGAEVYRGRAYVPGRSGTYTLTVRDTAGCEGTSPPHTVDVVPAPRARVSGPSTVCVGSAARYAAAAEPGAARQWMVTGGAAQSATDADTCVVVWNTAGTGRVILTLTRQGCTDADTVDVTIGTSLTPTIAGRSRICAGDTTLLDAGAGYRSYLWRLTNGDSADTPSIRIAAAGVYTVTVYDEGGCTGSAQHLLRVDVLPAPLIAGPREICAGDTAVLDAGVIAGVYTWRDAMGTMLGAQRTLAVTQTGVFTVTVTDTNSCTGSSPPHTLLVHPRPAQPVVTLRGDTLVTAAGYAYRWYRNDTLIAGAASDTHIAASPGWYHVSITDTHGCTNEADPVEYTGAARVATAHIILPFLEAAPGERVEIPVVIAASTRLDAADVRSVSGTLRFNHSVLVPIDSTPRGSIAGPDRIIAFSTPYSPLPTPNSPLITLRFLAALGSVSQTTLTLEDMNFGATDVRVTVQPGGFRLVVCREGGERLFSDSGRLSIGQNSPNPFNAQTTIEYETIENGPVFLAVYDLLGRETAVLVDAPLVPGRRRVLFDAQALPSGQYIAVLRSGSGVRTMWMVVAK